jgi:hypothetical protein
MKKHFVGFGFDTSAKGYHFLVVVPKEKDGNVSIYECFHWNPKEVTTAELCSRDLKAEIDLSKWNLFAPDVAQVLNERGKELVLLVWAINGYDERSTDSAIRNWRNLSHEERWWMFTMANSIGGGAYESEHGWRKAISYALCDNPTKADEKTEELFQPKPEVKKRQHSSIGAPLRPKSEKGGTHNDR